MAHRAAMLVGTLWFTVVYATGWGLDATAWALAVLGFALVLVGVAAFVRAALTPPRRWSEPAEPLNCGEWL